MMEHMEDLLQEENIALLKMYVYFDNPRKVIHNMQVRQSEKGYTHTCTPTCSQREWEWEFPL